MSDGAVTNGDSGGVANNNLKQTLQVVAVCSFCEATIHGGIYLRVASVP